jgi:hypothetical protein
LFFDEEIITLIVQETNRYAEKFTQVCTLKPRSCIMNWEPVMGDEIYVVLCLMMLMGIVQRTTMKSYFSGDAFLESPIFPQSMSQNQFELILKFLNFVDNSTIDTYNGPTKLFKIQSTVYSKLPIVRVWIIGFDPIFIVVERGDATSVLGHFQILMSS